MAIKARDKGKGDDEGDDSLFMPVDEILRKLKQGGMNFGVYQTSDKDRPVVLAAHKRKNPELLAKQAKKEAGTSKGTFGTVVLEGGELLFQCLSENVPKSLTKRIRLMLRNEGFSKFKARVVLANGEELGEFDDDEEGDDAGGTAAAEGAAEAPAEAAPDDETLAKWEGLRPGLESLANSDDARRGAQAGKLIKMMDAIMAGGDPKKGAAVLAMIEKLLEDAGDSAPQAATAEDAEAARRAQERAEKLQGLELDRLESMIKLFARNMN